MTLDRRGAAPTRSEGPEDPGTRDGEAWPAYPVCLCWSTAGSGMVRIMASGDWVDPATLTPGELATADQNWAIANSVLTDLITQLRKHRATGCADWTCAGATGLLMEHMDDGQIHMLARAAVERLAASAPP